MGLIEDIASEQEASRPNRCAVHRIRHSLPDADAADLETALADPAITTSAIHRALMKRGFKVDPKGIAYHRKGTCACAR